MNWFRRSVAVEKSAAAVEFCRVRMLACWPRPTTTMAWRPAASDWSPWSQRRVRVAEAAVDVDEAAVLFDEPSDEVLFDEPSDEVLFDEPSDEVLFDELSGEVLFDEESVVVLVAVALLDAAAAPAAAAFPAEEDLEEALPVLATVVALALFRCAGAAATEEMAIKAKRAAVNFIV